MFKKKEMNIPRPLHHDVKEQRFPDLSDMDLNIPSYNPMVKEGPKKVYSKEVEGSMFQKPLAKPSSRNIVRDNTLFVKIDKYQESMRTLNLIKESLMNTEHILTKLHQIKSQEDDEIQKWHDQIKRIKQKIVYIDKNLFEQ
tara:strand:+ start:4752 stop:5174 length:423 start_codon:yes stop_codon:yes gene_type:complete